MKRYERELLNNLVGETNIGDEEPLKNVKKALGSLSSVVGNPMFKAEITLQINLYLYASIGGLPAVLIAPAALPVGLQTSIPVKLLGLTDFYSAYFAQESLCRTILPWVSLGKFINGVGGGSIAPNVVNGDMVLNYQAVLGPDNYTAIIVIHCSNIAYGTFLNSFVSDLITVNLLRIIVPIANINQLINPLIFGYQTLFGKLSTDSIDPRMYKTPTDFQNQIADIPITFPIDKNLMIGFYMDVFCLQMFITLFANKVEPLTHK